MNEVAFIEGREPAWKRLAYLTEKADASPVNLSAAELQEFIRLYRKCSTDLALVRTKSNNVQLIDFLNDLLGKAYATLYRTKRKPFWRAIADAIGLTARTVRKLKWCVLASFSVFAGSIVFSYFASAANPELKNVLEPPESEIAKIFKAWKSGVMAPADADRSLAMSGFYSANNPFQSILTVGMSVGTFGILGTNHLYTNGAMIGTLTYEMSTVGRTKYLWIRLMPHGVTELSGLILAGAAGYWLVWALINPGRRKRGAALTEAGKDGMVVATAAVLMMFIAAPVEGFFSFNPRIPEVFKVLFALFAAIAWGVFWIGYGHLPKAEQDGGRVAGTRNQA